MRAIAVMRERYGFTALESLDMAYEDFDRWLSALSDEEETPEQDNDTWVAVTDRLASK